MVTRRDAGSYTCQVSALSLSLLSSDDQILGRAGPDQGHCARGGQQGGAQAVHGQHWGQGVGVRDGGSAPPVSLRCSDE